MKRMNRINEIWNQLSLTNLNSSGLFKIRYSETSKCDLFLGLKCPEKNRMLILQTPSKLAQNFNFKYDFKGVRFEKVYDPDSSDYILLNLVLIDNLLTDIFNSLINDIIKSITDKEDYKTILKDYSNRLLKWQSLFEKAYFNGLSPEEQRGLFGELYFLRKLLSGNDLLNVLNLWMGPENQIHDFQNGDCSVEVKTTYGNNHQRIQISSERQLDVSHIGHLFLFHLSLDSRHQDGETLNQMVNSISLLLDSDSAAMNKFNSKLLAAGYFNHHRELYNDTGYLLRHENYYKVELDFPRIEEADVRHGVGDVKYSIIVSGCQDYLISENLVTETLLNHA